MLLSASSATVLTSVITSAIALIMPGSTLPAVAAISSIVRFTPNTSISGIGAVRTSISGCNGSVTSATFSTIGPRTSVIYSPKSNCTLLKARYFMPSASDAPRSSDSPLPIKTNVFSNSHKKSKSAMIEGKPEALLPPNKLGDMPSVASRTAAAVTSIPKFRPISPNSARPRRFRSSPPPLSTSSVTSSETTAVNSVVSSKPSPSISRPEDVSAFRPRKPSSPLIEPLGVAVAVNCSSLISSPFSSISLPTSR